jgi:hypothetical protein
MKVRALLVRPLNFGKKHIPFKKLFGVMLCNPASLLKRKEMKKSFLALSLMIGSYSYCQPAIKLYGYSQVFTPGMVLERQPGEPQRKGVVSYYLYFAASSAVNIRPSEIWIKGERFQVKEASVIKTPVKSPTDDLLVPKSTLRVREMKYEKKLPALKSTPTWLKKLLRENELVLAYYWQGKKYYKGLKKIKELETVMGE